MAAPARRSLRERDQRAIDPTPLPGQTAIDMPDTPGVEPASRHPRGAAAPPAAPTNSASTRRTAAAARSGARRLGIYFHPADFTNAKAAYLTAWQDGGDAETFAAWIAAVLTDHTQLTPAQRAAASLPKRAGRAGATRSFTLPQSVHDAVHAAVIADQDAGRWVSASTWAAVALHAAVQTAEQRAGGRLPTPPQRLPNRLQR